MKYNFERRILNKISLHFHKVLGMTWAHLIKKGNLNHDGDWMPDLIQCRFCAFSSSFQSRLRGYIKLLRECFTTFSNTSKFIRNTPLRVVFATLFSVSGNIVKHDTSCLIYYCPNSPKKELLVVTQRYYPSYLSGFIRLQLTSIHCTYKKQTSLMCWGSGFKP